MRAQAQPLLQRVGAGGMDELVQEGVGKKPCDDAPTERHELIGTSSGTL